MELLDVTLEQVGALTFDLATWTDLNGGGVMVALMPLQILKSRKALAAKLTAEQVSSIIYQFAPLLWLRAIVPLLMVPLFSQRI